MNKFDKWFYEVEQYGTRAERLFAELNHDGVQYRVVKEWLKAAHEDGKGESPRDEDYYDKVRFEAAVQAQKFIDCQKDALGIFTLRKAFELGYIKGRTDETIY